MELNTAKADGKSYGTPEKPGEADSFSREYYRACKMLLDARPQDFEGGYDSLRGAAAFLNTRMEEARQKICTHMTDWLYEHGGEVVRWPHTDSGIYLACRDRDENGRVSKATFSYFGWEISESEENGELLMCAVWPQKRDFPYGGAEPVMPGQPGRAAKSGPNAKGGRAAKHIPAAGSTGASPDAEEFRKYYENVQKKAAEALKKAEADLAQALGQKDFSAAEEKELRSAKAELKQSRKRRKLPFLYKLFVFLLLFTLPGYIFSAMGGMPEELNTKMYELTQNGTWWGYAIWLPWLVWQLPELAVMLIAALGGKSIVWRFVTLLILAAVEVLGGMVALEFLLESSVTVKMKDWWSDLKAKPGKVRNAKKRLREAKRAYKATTEEARETARKQNEDSAKARIKELEGQLEIRRKERLDSVNMRKWHESFTAFQRGQEYRETKWIDPGEKERRGREKAAYEAAMKNYEKACAVYESKKQLCALWQAAWYRYLNKEEVPAAFSDTV